MSALRLAARVTSAAAITLLALAVPAGAATSEWTAVFPETVENPCNGDTVYVDGKMHTVLVESDSKSEATVDWAGTTGLGVPSGSLYEVENTTHTYILSRPAGQITFSGRVDMEVISKDPTQNFIVHQTLQFTVDAETFDLIDEKITPDGTKCVG